ncbi:MULTISPECIES: hypothetical protein [Rhodococcus]|uniref:hypothetical protein n=1 Tax=Rhodococcus TaxID=1827 RepID=UPI001AEF6D74|nr:MULTISPECIES: hypothetical protein [Rhodococcus]QTR98399.1 hypothetical protein J6K27_003530 [Rhodococcus qingshengii]WEX03854.1 hypothetical protein P0M12_30335 [Rhodococcus sp. RCBS9]WEX03933.1 hypothetical protein P0M12_00350 [Rhodococcus sp. RCBS9]
MAYTDSDLIHEYKHFRSFGFSNAEIAEKLGYVKPDVMMARLKQLGVVTDSAYQARAREVVDRLVCSGVPFTVEMLPTLAEPSLGFSLVRTAHAEGRVVKVGRCSSRRPHSGAVAWQGVAA